MTIVPSLQDLNQNRKALLLAEVAALLHDVGKLSSQFIDQMSNEPSACSNGFAHENAVEKIEGFVDKRFLDAFKQSALRNQLRWDRIPNNEQIGQVLDLILHHDKAKHSALLVQLLNRCDGLDSGADKGTTRVEGLPKEAKQAFDSTYLATAFGTESKLDPQTLDTIRQKSTATIGNMLGGSDANAIATRYREILNTIKEMYANGLAETRRSANDVTLWDHSFSVATLYKSSLAAYLLKDVDHLHWRVLRVNFDVLGLYAKAIKIADLLAYQNAVDEACRKVKNLVEEEYPLGNEIYRDTTGIYFTFPDLELPADLGQEIRRRVEEVEPELAPRIAVTVGDGATAQEQLKSILGKARREALENLKQPFDAVNLSPVWQQVWEKVGTDEKKWEVCPLCGLRPKEEHAEVCAHCEQRRASRLNVWKQNPARTIWLGEIADHNDRVALLVGKFGLEDWLSGDLVQTMLVKAVENNPGACVPKNPSPARLRRVWETCQRFWDDAVLQEILAQKLGNRGQRKRIVPDRTEWQPGLYNGKVNGKPLDLFWQPEYKAFLTISNLQASGALQQGDLVSLEHPESKQKAEFQIQAICEAPAPFDHYISFLSLPASPDQFLAFIPAADALDIIQEIQKQYAEQFGKVRNRLPLFLGLVYFELKMPLIAVMDAARQMLNAPLASESWQLKATDGKGHVEFENGITWDLPTKMGDGKTEDCWYPYFELTDLPASPRAYQFQHNGKTWVHVKNMQQGDTVRLTPSRFDFEFLDTNARRFEIYYDENGRRLRPTRPFYLEDLERLEKLWKYMERLTKTQRHQVIRTIEGTRERWYGNDNNGHSITDEVFRQFVHDTLAGASWPKGQSWSSNPQEWQEKLVQAGVRGELSDLAELHMEILKEKGGRDGNL